MKDKWLTKLNVSASFDSARMAKREELKTAFQARYGLFEWKVSPFGHTGLSPTFERFLNWVLRDLFDDFCTTFVDDFLVFSCGSFNDGRSKISEVLQRLLNNNPSLYINNCELETKTTIYNGFIVGVGVSL